ncbi:MAG: PEP-utilizing enzyme [Candidatus Moranbacteria bacterium]|nr:PEP-utilizing enzyme [Candidatus Moranbacteria bacterium]
MNISDFQNRKWVVLGANCYPLYADSFAEPVSQGYYRTYGIPNEVLGVFNKDFFEWLYDNSQLVALSEKLLPGLLSTPWNYYDEWQKNAKSFSVFHESVIEKDFTALSHKELGKLAKEYHRIFWLQFAPSNIIEPLSYYFQSRFKKMLTLKGTKENEIDQLMDYYGRSKYPNYIKECLAEYRLAKNEDVIQAVLKKYAYLANDYLGPKVLTKAYLDELLKQETHEPHVGAVPAVSPETQLLLEVFQMVATIQDVRKAYSLMMIAGVHNFAIEYAKRLKLPDTLIWYALWKEIYAGDVNEKKLEERREHSVILWGKKETVACEGIEAEKLAADIHTLVFGSTKDVKKVKGICASPGKVTGRAVVVMHPDEFHKVKKGDVLFTMMTRPEYLPVMQLAAAFVTDEGGITSHAAIVAREMKKPCIIATKIGTKVVKDGDLVEVDADKGIVRILEKKK